MIRSCFNTVSSRYTFPLNITLALYHKFVIHFVQLMTKQHVCQAAFGKKSQGRIESGTQGYHIPVPSWGCSEQSGRLRCHSLGGGLQDLGVQIKTALALAPLGLRAGTQLQCDLGGSIFQFSLAYSMLMAG